MGTLPVKMAPRRLWCVTCVLALTLVLNTVEADANNLGHDTNEGLSNEIFDASRLTATTDRDANKEVSHEATSSDRGGHQAYKLVKSRTECGGRETSSNQVSVEACAAKCVSGFFAYGRKSGRCSGSKCKCLCEKVGTQCKQVSHAHYDLYRHAQATATTQAVAKKKDSKYQQSKGEFTFSPISTHSEGTKVLYVTDKDLRASNSQSTGTTLFPGPGEIINGFDKNVQVSTNFSLSFWIKLGDNTFPHWQGVARLGSGWSINPKNGKTDRDNWYVMIPPTAAVGGGFSCSVYVGRYECLGSMGRWNVCHGKPTFTAFKSDLTTGCIPQGRWTYVAMAFTPTSYDIRVNGQPHMKGFLDAPIPEMSGTKILRIGGTAGNKNPDTRGKKPLQIAHLTYYNSDSYASGGPETLLAMPEGIGKYVTKNETGGCKFPQAAYPIDHSKGFCMPIGSSPDPFCVNVGSNTSCHKNTFEIKNWGDIIYGIHLVKKVHCYSGSGTRTCKVDKQVGCYVALKASWNYHNEAFKGQTFHGGKTYKMIGQQASVRAKQGLFAHPESHSFAACTDVIAATSLLAESGYKRTCLGENSLVKNFDCPLFTSPQHANKTIAHLVSEATQSAMTA